MADILLNKNASGMLSDEQIVPAIEWVAEQMPGGFFVYRADDTQEIVYVNQATYHIFGCENAEEFSSITQNTFRGMVHPEDFEKIQKSIDDQIADEKNANNDYVEYRIIRKDGTIRWVDDYGHYAHLPGYGDVYYVFIGDITEKHLAQEENRRRANIYGSMLAQFNAFADDSLTVMRIDLTSGITEEVRGRDFYMEDEAGRAFLDSIDARRDSFLIEGDRDRYLELFMPEKMMTHYAKGQEQIVFVGYCKRQSGRQCFVKFSATLASDPVSGDLIALYAETEYNTEQVTDVLGRRVLASQYDMVTYIVGTHYGVVIGDSSNIRKGNIFPKKREGNYMSYIKDQVLPVVDASGDELLEIERKLSLETIKKELLINESYAVEVSCLIDHETYRKKFTYYPVDREMSFYILLKEDLTEVIKKERAQNELLASALEDARRANQAKSDFLSNMSHEIRTPITAILGMNELIQRASINEEVLGYADNIEKAGMSLLGIISDILDFSKIEAGRMELSEADYLTENLLNDLMNLTHLRAEDKGLKLETKIDKNLPRKLFGDELRLKQIITNLMVNAIKYTEKGRVTLEMSLREKKGDRAVIFVSVKDTGIGIKDDEADKLFKAFDRLDMDRTRTIEGTGLGLSITNELLKLMGSSLNVKSSYGSGSDFFFIIEQRIVEDAALGEFNPYAFQKSGKIGRKTAGFTAPEARILIVDDTPMNLQVIAGLLKRTGMKIDTAESGRACIDAFVSGSEYDVVFLDYRMPEMDGIETLKVLCDRFPDKVARTPIVCLTASAVAGDREKMLAAGFSDYLAKPINIYEVEELLRKYLGDKVRATEVSEADTSYGDHERELGYLPEELFGITEIDPSKGIEFCGDAADYMDAIDIYRSSIDKKIVELRESAGAFDFERFTNLTHSLKSTSRMIGAINLSEKAFLLEQSGRKRDMETIKRELEDFILSYRDLQKALERVDT